MIPLAMGKSIRVFETGRSENLLYLSVTRVEAKTWEKKARVADWSPV